MNLVVYAGNVINATNTRYCDDFKVMVVAPFATDATDKINSVI